LPHVESIEPYLKSQSSDASSVTIYQNITIIMEHTVPLIGLEIPDLVASLTKDLSALLYTQGMPVIQCCTKCLCTIVSRVSRKIQVPESLYKSFYSYLENIKDKSLPPATVTSQLAIIRSLFTLGHLCKNFDFDDDVMKINDFDILEDTKYGTHVEDLYGMLIQFWENREMNIKVVALMSIGALFASYPGIIIRSKGIIEDILSPTTHPRLKHQLLIILDSFLTDEEEKMKIAKQQMDEYKMNADSGVASSIIQYFLGKILNFLFGKDSNIRFAAVNLINHIIKRS